MSEFYLLSLYLYLILVCSFPPMNRSEYRACVPCRFTCYGQLVSHALTVPLQYYLSIVSITDISK
jgi:hypothetical protein